MPNDSQHLNVNLTVREFRKTKVHVVYTTIPCRHDRTVLSCKCIDHAANIYLIICKRKYTYVACSINTTKSRHAHEYTWLIYSSQKPRISIFPGALRRPLNKSKVILIIYGDRCPPKET